MSQNFVAFSEYLNFNIFSEIGNKNDQIYFDFENENEILGMVYPTYSSHRKLNKKSVLWDYFFGKNLPSVLQK